MAEGLGMRVPVLVVGGGPVGLGMALELAWQGVDSLLIDQGDGSVEHPRTGLIAVRTMELFRRWGLAQRIRDAGFPPDYELSMVFCTSLNGQLLAREPYPSMRDTPTPPETPEKKQRCPQSWMQPVLADAAAFDDAIELITGLLCDISGSIRSERHPVVGQDPLRAREVLLALGRQALVLAAAAHDGHAELLLERADRVRQIAFCGETHRDSARKRCTAGKRQLYRRGFPIIGAP